MADAVFEEIEGISTATQCIVLIRNERGLKGLLCLNQRLFEIKHL